MDAAAVIQWIADLILRLLQSMGYWGVFLAMFIESACIPISSEVVLLFAGFLVRKGQFSLTGMAFSAALGFALGSLVPYTLGRVYGRAVLAITGRFFFTSQNEIDKVENWFSRYGEMAILFTRIIPVVRDFISFPAGSSRMPIWRFLPYTFFGILPWTYFVVYLGSVLGAHWDEVIGVFAAGNSIVLWILISAVLILFLRHLYFVYWGKPPRSGSDNGKN